MSTPTQHSDTPRTDAAWAKTFQDDEDQCRAGNAATDMRDECATLERELAALAAERDQLRAALALGQQNCDDAYDDLRAERAAAIARGRRFLVSQPHDPDVKALIRLAVVWNIPVACNQATADFIIHSSLYQQNYQREVPDFAAYQQRFDNKS